MVNQVTVSKNISDEIEGEKELQIPSQQEIITLKHALKVLNRLQIIDVLAQNKYQITKKIKKVGELVELLIQQFTQGLLVKSIYEDIREAAFNPELDVSDGFFLSFLDERLNITKSSFEQAVDNWNESDSQANEIDSNVEIINFRDQVCKLSVTRFNERYAYDKNSMFSTRFVDESKVLVEIDFSKNIIFFQTSNSKKYREVQRVIKLLLSIFFENDKFKLFPPKMSRKLNFSLVDDGNTAVRYDNISPNTIKLLDLILEMNEAKFNFENLECIDITFDHEDSKKEDLKAKIERQGFGGGDLLEKQDIKNHILQNRVILKVELNLVYIEKIDDERKRKHILLAGIDNKANNYLRIYIHNNNLNLKRVINKAYKELKTIFVEHNSSTNLRNEEKIKRLLGL
ncbi:hypothetical protein [Bacillus wiedmannii]|uniref:hypothetical protein n=1 Tax=Bacillus wiedmannii TaxID=1890302 RepID=UPI000BF72FAD|nr:hypothetical protein [Bacillus wiedmannii]PEU28634.1 hypothetical protein CN532_11450 [Bacillus wiedmannii]